MFFLSSISSSLEICLVNHILIYESTELKVFKNITFLSETSNNWSNDFLGKKVHKTTESCW